MQPEDMEAAEVHFERAWKRFGEAEMLIPEADRGQPMKPMQVRLVAERRLLQTYCTVVARL